MSFNLNISMWAKSYLNYVFLYTPLLACKSFFDGYRKWGKGDSSTAIAKHEESGWFYYDMLSHLFFLKIALTIYCLHHPYFTKWNIVVVTLTSEISAKIHCKYKLVENYCLAKNKSLL
jgi:hypothetical protein